MATTRQLDLTSEWTALAEGQGDLAFTAAAEALWVVSDEAGPPSLTYGHTARSGENVSLRLMAGERLWMKGNGSAVLTAENALIP
ncbi:hypothetical protein EYE35_03200 [Cereibacter sphaeroides]|nr:hypothetical protein EYE35_03200 [Cereibacter sphaeroides]